VDSGAIVPEPGPDDEVPRASIGAAAVAADEFAWKEVSGWSYPRQGLGATMAGYSTETLRSMTIKQVMTVAPYSVRRDHALVVATALMAQKRIRHLPVLHERRVVGVLAERDLLLAEQMAKAREADGRPEPMTVGEAALSAPLVVAPTERLSSVVAQMVASRAEIVIVVDADRIVGVFTTIDALAFLSKLLGDAGVPSA
jgi:CBS domain-containing protein